MESWVDWALRLARVTIRARRQAPDNVEGRPWGAPDLSIRGRRLARLESVCREELSAWYQATRWVGSGPAPEDRPDLADALRDAGEPFWRRYPGYHTRPRS